MKNTKTQLITIALITFLPFLVSAQITSYPYTQSFEDPIVLDWTNLAPSGSDTCGDWEYGIETGTPGTGPNSASDGSNFLFLDGDNCGTAIPVNTESPTFSLAGLNMPTFTFDHFRYGINVGDMDVQISNDGGVWTTLPNGSFSGSIQNDETDPWTSESFDLSAYIDQNVMIRFAAIDNVGSALGDIAIDNLTLYDAGIINGSGDVSFFYDEAGNRTRREYTVTSMAQSEQELIASVRSVEEGSKIEFLDDELFKIYPNPASDFINIDQIESTGPTTIHLLDAAGRELYIAHMTEASQTQFDMSSFRSGVYVLWIQMEDRVVTKKIIKH